MNSTRPYFLRAIWEWAEDSGLTPQLLVNAEAEGVDVPREYVSKGQIVLNISSSAVRLDTMDNEKVIFSARFNGLPRDIYLPMDSIMAIYARENGHGLWFQEADEDKQELELEEVSGEQEEGTTRDRSHLKIIK